MRRVSLLVIAASLAACAPRPKNPDTLSSTRATMAGQNGKSILVTEEMIGSQFPPLELTKTSKSASYAFTQTSPVRFRDEFGSTKNIYRYLNALLGPNGESVHYDRIGTCCAFKLESAETKTGLLEVYEISVEGTKGTRRIYFNWDDPGDPLVPLGFTARRE